MDRPALHGICLLLRYKSLCCLSRTLSNVSRRKHRSSTALPLQVCAAPAPGAAAADVAHRVPRSPSPVMASEKCIMNTSVQCHMSSHGVNTSVQCHMSAEESTIMSVTTDTSFGTAGRRSTSRVHRGRRAASSATQTTPSDRHKADASHVLRAGRADSELVELRESQQFLLRVTSQLQQQLLMVATTASLGHQLQSQPSVPEASGPGVPGMEPMDMRPGSTMWCAGHGRVDPTTIPEVSLDTAASTGYLHHHHHYIIPCESMPSADCIVHDLATVAATDQLSPASADWPRPRYGPEHFWECGEANPVPRSESPKPVPAAFCEPVPAAGPPSLVAEELGHARPVSIDLGSPNAGSSATFSPQYARHPYPEHHSPVQDSYTGAPMVASLVSKKPGPEGLHRWPEAPLSFASGTPVAIPVLERQQGLGAGYGVPREEQEVIRMLQNQYRSPDATPISQVGSDVCRGVVWYTALCCTGAVLVLCCAVLLCCVLLC